MAQPDEQIPLLSLVAWSEPEPALVRLAILAALTSA